MFILKVSAGHGAQGSGSDFSTSRHSILTTHLSPLTSLFIFATKVYNLTEVLKKYLFLH